MACVLRREREDETNASWTYFSTLALTYLYSSANSLSPSFAPTGAHLSPDGLLSLLSSEFSTSSFSQSTARECRECRWSSIVSLSLSYAVSPTSCLKSTIHQHIDLRIRRAASPRYSRRNVYVP